MAVLIQCAGKPILRLRNTLFEMIYENIDQNIEENRLELSPNLSSLIERLYSATFGLGADIASFLKTYDDTVYFADLVKQAIEKSIKDYPTLTEETKQALWNFHKSILEYADTLK